MKPCVHPLAFACALTVAGGAVAVNIKWTDPDGGAFGDQTNWVGEVIPGMDDTPVFDLMSAYTIDVEEPRSVLRMFVNEGDVTLDLNGFEYELRRTSAQDLSLSVGSISDNNADLTIRDGTLVCRFAEIANGFGRKGSVTFADPGARLTAMDSFRVGRFAFGALNVLNDARATIGNDLVVGESNNGSGEVVVAGEASSVLVADQLQVGALGSGSVTVEGAAFLECLNGFVAAFQGSGGEVVVRDKGSVWQNDGALGVGFSGVGQLLVEADGLVTCAVMSLGFDDTGFGVATVRGDGSELRVDGQLLVGAQGVGEFIVRQSGFARALTVSVSSAAGAASLIVEDSGSEFECVGEISAGAEIFGSVIVRDFGRLKANNLSIGGFGRLAMDRSTVECPETVVQRAGVIPSRGESPEAGLFGNGQLTGNLTLEGLGVPGPEIRTFTIGGNLTIGENAILRMDVEDDPKDLSQVSDAFDVGGDLAINGGSLEVAQTGAITVDLGDRVALIRGAASATGRFDEADLPGLGAGKRFILDYHAGGVDLLVTKPGDLDGDMVVGTQDLGTLLAAWGTTDPNADLSGDGVVDSADLAVLIAAWG